LFVLVLQAVAGTVLLGFGGWLVIQGQLTLGQLVAAELIVAAILGSLAKLGKHLEGFYDLMAAVEKLGQMFDLPLERRIGIMHSIQSAGARVKLTDVNCIVRGEAVWSRPISLSVAAGTWVGVTGKPGSGKSLLLDVLYGLRPPARGHVEIDQVDPFDVRPDVLRQFVALARPGEFFEGTLAENVHLHRPELDSARVRRALELVGLLDDALRLPQGLDTRLTSGGAPLSSTQQAALALARALAGEPKLLLADAVLDGLPDDEIEAVISRLRQSRQSSATILIATNRRTVADACDTVIDLDRGDVSVVASRRGGLETRR
jgi:ABC-type bacteriocin/lantibiotic exporter with double-glycine peptidase domain